MDNKGTLDGLRKGEKEYIKPRAGDADLWIKFGKNYMNGELVERGISWWKWNMSRHTAQRRKKKR